MAAASFSARDCPICGGRPRGPGFPYATRFDDQVFAYLRCGSCATVFVDPVPQPSTLHKMYAKADYHDCHYEGVEEQAYRESIEFLSKYLEPGNRILDYGCGTGSFLCACADRGYIPFGVDFDTDVARAAGARAKCRSASVDDFEHMAETDFDVIHLGDVLEHLTDPAATIALLLERLKPGGLLYVEGPIETNASPVHWAARLFGMAKKALRPTFIASFPPTHLLRTDAAAQAQFFSWIDGALRPVAWKVEETGWPYNEGGLVKRFIASVAKALGGRRILDVEFGNRFKAILQKPDTSARDSAALLRLPSSR